jgi:aminomethyltransferase
LLNVASDQIVRLGPPRPSVIIRPGMRALAAGEEIYTVPGGGVIAVPIHAGDRVRVVDVEGMQCCEMVAADAVGAIDASIIGVRGDSDASSLKRILSGNSESARSVRAGLERRGIAGRHAVRRRIPPGRCKRVHGVA